MSTMIDGHQSLLSVPSSISQFRTQTSFSSKPPQKHDARTQQLPHGGQLGKAHAARGASSARRARGRRRPAGWSAACSWLAARRDRTNRFHSLEAKLHAKVA